MLLRQSLILSFCVLGGSATAQIVPQLQPFDETLDLLVVDASFDGVWRFSDRNQDGDYNDAGEIVPFYDDTLGAVSLTNPNCITSSPTGVTYIADSTVDVVLSLIDTNGDGDALDAGEHDVFFDSATNLSGIVMTSSQGITTDAFGVVYVAVSNSSSGTDLILRLEDRNGDGDANDLGEATDYCTIPNASGSTGASIPTIVRVAPNGKLYYTDVGSRGSILAGVYELDDLNLDGDCNDPGEVKLFWVPPAPAQAFFWGLVIDKNGRFYLSDHGNEQIWTGRDANFDGMIDATEQQLYYQSTASTWWDLVLRDDGVLLACEDQNPDRVLAFEDLNGDGDANDPGEVSDAYSDLTSSTDVRPRGAAFSRGPGLAIQPAQVQVGQTVTITIQAEKPGDNAFLLASDQLAAAPLSVAPFGVLGLDSGVLLTVAQGVADSSGQFAVPINVPNTPSLAGNYPFQAFAGDLFRSYLSPARVLVLTP